jgi:hypothetical protein
MRKALAVPLSILLSSVFFAVAYAQTATVVKKAPKLVKVIWNVTLDGKLVSKVTYRETKSVTGARYMSWRLKPEDKKKPPSWVLFQVKADGALQKYQRLEDKRKGAGVIAFSKGNKVRVVGRNQKRAPVEMEVAYHLLWDPMGWLTLSPWMPKLAKAAGPVRLSMYDVEKGRSGDVEAVPTESKLYKAKDNSEVPVKRWTLVGLGPIPVLAYTNMKGALMAVTSGDRRLTRSGFLWEPIPSKDEPVPDADKASVKDSQPAVKDSQPAVKEKVPAVKEKVPDEDSLKKKKRVEDASSKKVPATRPAPVPKPDTTKKKEETP